MVEEAHLEELDSGLAPLTDGWFLVNVRDAAWLTNDAFGARCVFEGDKPVLRKRPDLAVHRFADVGFTLEPAAQGRGIATAVVREAVRLVFAATGVLQVRGITDSRNEPSARLLERLGFRHEADRDVVFRGEACSEQVYVLKRHDAQPSRGDTESDPFRSE